jgi:hypothetical protein
MIISLKRRKTWTTFRTKSNYTGHTDELHNLEKFDGEKNTRRGVELCFKKFFVSPKN